MAEAEVSMEEARDFIDRFFSGRPRLREYIEELKALAAAQGYVETMFGRRRYLPEIITGVPALRAEAERQAVNTPIQGTQADVIKIAMVNLHKILPKEFGDDLIMIMQVHDELVFEIKDSRVHEAAGIIQEIMENAVKLSVPTVVEVDIGKNWGEMRKWSR
jgi:DNA polymerase-1